MRKQQPTHSLAGALAIAAVILVVAYIVFFSSPASSAAARRQMMCAPYKELLNYAARFWSERPVASGIIGDTSYLQVLASPDGSTFTVIIVNVNGTACVKTDGYDWEIAPTPPEREG